MKKTDLSHWKKTGYTNNILLFAETFLECSDNNSFESYKAPVLTLHTLCYDMLYTKEAIESKNQNISAGSFIPLTEEFEYMVQSDQFVLPKVDYWKSIFYKRNKNGTYTDYQKESNEAKINVYSKAASLLIELFNANACYYYSLHDTLIETIYELQNDQRKSIYHLTRSVVTELFNSGYHRKYLNERAREYFFDPNKEVDCTNETVGLFLDIFNKTKKRFMVSIEINPTIYKVLKNAEAIETSVINQDNSSEEKYMASVIVEKYDEFSALEKAVEIISFYLAIHSMSNHMNYSISKKGRVEIVNQDGRVVSSVICDLESDVSKHEYKRFGFHQAFIETFLIRMPIQTTSTYKAITLHKGALDNSDLTNQLLNFWTIIEILIEPKNSDNDKISQICDVLCPILTRGYIYYALQQLYEDVKQCIDLDLEQEIKSISDNIFLNETERFAMILGLDKNQSSYDQIYNSLNDYPLLQYRMTMFKQEILINSDTIFQFLERHRKRIRWQIMRIYRNRNLIVHDGSYLPYIDQIVDNLHFYVDTLIETLIEHYCLGIKNNENIYQFIQMKENNYIRNVLKRSNEKGKKDMPVLIDEDNFMQIVFNNYSGNQFEKIIQISNNNR